MSIPATPKNLSKYDFNHDGKLDHGDVDAYIMELENGGTGSIKVLLRMMKAGGEVNIKDIQKIVDDCKVTGYDIERFVEMGGTVTAEDIDTLIKAGVEFTPKQLEEIGEKTGLKNLSVFPSGTKPADLIAMATSGTKKVTAEDMLSLKGPDGKPLATVNDFLKLKEAGVKVPATVLHKFQEAGGTITAADLMKFADAGVKLTSIDLVKFAEAGMVIKDTELAHIKEKAKITLTQEDLTKINPVSSSTGKPIISPDAPLTPATMLEMAKLGATFTGAEMVALKGPDGKPLATAADLVKLAQAGGTVAPADVIALQAAGVPVTGEEVATLVTAGVKFTAADLVTLTKGGTVFKEDQLHHICNNSGIGLTKQEFIDINPICLKTGQPYVEKVAGPVTIDPILTPEALAAAASFGVPVSVKDVAASQDGTMHIQDIIKFVKDGGTVTVQELVELLKSGTKFSSREVTALHEAGMDFTTQDLITLSDAGCIFFDKDIKKFIDGGLNVTFEDFVAIHPGDPESGSTGGAWRPGPYGADVYLRAMDAGVKVSGPEFVKACGVFGGTKQAVMDFLGKGGTLSAQDVFALNKMLKFDGDDIVELVDKGVKLTVDDLVQLSKDGMVIWQDDLDYVCKKLDIAYTYPQRLEINPVVGDGERMKDDLANQ